jgi:uncharacterized protein (TIGR03067 family)
MKVAATAVVGFALCLAGSAVQAGGGKADVKKLQGKWTGMGEGGTVVVLEFSKDSFTFTMGDKGSFKGTFKTGTAKKPYEIDLAVSEGPEAKYKGKTSLGIWEFDGDTLKWCGAEPGNTTRPTTFDEKGKNLCVTFKRTK